MRRVPRFGQEASNPELLQGLGLWLRTVLQGCCHSVHVSCFQPTAAGVLLSRQV